MKGTKEIYLAAIDKIEKFSPAPRVLGTAMALLRDPNADIEELGRLIKTDSALTSDILRGANSVYYNLGDKVSSLEAAVQRIGFRECMRLLNLSVAHTLSNNELSCYGITAEDYWAESLFNGLFMEGLAKKIGTLDPDTAHTTGLLRYIGRLAINRSLIDLGMGLFWNGSSPLAEWDLSQVGFTQSHAAGRLMKVWQFSEEVVRAIEFQEQPDQADSVDDLLAAMHFTALVLPPGQGLSFATLPGDGEQEDPVQTDFVRRFGLNEENTKELLDQTRAHFSSINSSLYES